jgi:DNA replication protein DnaC
MSAPIDAEIEIEVTRLLASFRLPTASQEMVGRVRDAGHEEALPVLLEVLRAEADGRKGRRVERLRKASKLPLGKTLATLDMTKFPLELQRRIRELTSGAFRENAVNILAFGLPGTGKTHASCAIGNAMVEAGHSVLFTPAYKLVQDLLAAKRDLVLPKALRKLDAFDLLILDDIGYIKQRPDEVEVLFTLMAERYERRSLMITSNLVFSEWDQIFQNPMTTAAAIDRLVHHSVILEFDVPSYRSAEQISESSPSGSNQ